MLDLENVDESLFMLSYTEVESWCACMPVIRLSFDYISVGM